MMKQSFSFFTIDDFYDQAVFFLCYIDDLNN